ncbi:MAG: hypothetical protein OJF48_003606 [Afipia sp.]|nr:MAG: hypothetical protein OJF48_003606 [Afipia sp.]
MGDFRGTPLSKKKLFLCSDSPKCSFCENEIHIFQSRLVS